MLPRSCLFETLEGSLGPVDISPEPVDGFSKFKRRLEAEKNWHNLYRIDFQIFVSVTYRQLQFSYYFDFQMRKTHLKSFLISL